ncbi:MAG: hypothetical protein OXI46_08480 [Gemmatimonadota bacterium]|nr:hypothetical protein [Gemmatimonadota bacterium]
MEGIGLRQDVPRDPVAQILTHEGRSIALVDLGRDASEALRRSWPADRPFQSGGVIESTWLLPIIGTGSAAAASLFAGNVFLATANPATLMTIGSGVGSAVMGPTGIVAAAPFVAASGALIPVVAPIMLFTTVSSVMMSARLDRVQKTLGQLEDSVGEVRGFQRAADYGQLEHAAFVIDQVRSEFEHRRRFASDVPAKLLGIQQNAGALRKKYRLLTTRDVHSEDHARSAVVNLDAFFLASVCELQVDLLQLYLALQNDPDVVEGRQLDLRKKIERYNEDFRQALDDDSVGAFHRKLKGESTKSFLPRSLHRFFRGVLARMERERNVRAIRKDLLSVQARIKQWTDEIEAASEEPREQSIVFFREPKGKRALRAYHTRDVRVERAAAM